MQLSGGQAAGQKQPTGVGGTKHRRTCPAGDAGNIHKMVKMWMGDKDMMAMGNMFLDQPFIWADLSQKHFPQGYPGQVRIDQ